MWTCLIEGNLPYAIQLLKATAEQLSQIQYPIDKLKISVFNFISIAYRHLNSNYYDEDTEENEQQTFLAIERATTAYQVYDGVAVSYTHLDVYKRQTYAYDAVNRLAGGYGMAAFGALLILGGMFFLVQNVMQISMAGDIRQMGCLLYTSRCV